MSYYIGDKIALISFASKGRENYLQMIERLAKTAKFFNFPGDIILFTKGREEIGHENVLVVPDYPTTKTFGKSKTHQEVPYQFKPFAFQYCREQGYEQVIWMDSSTLILRDVVHVFETLTSMQFMMPDNPGCTEYRFTADDALEKMGCSLEEAKTFFQIMACVMMMDFRFKRPNEVLDEWLHYSMDGVTFIGAGGSRREDYGGHRHDQSCMSYLLKKRAIPHIPYGLLVYPYGEWMNEFRPVFINWGSGQLPLPLQEALNKVQVFE
jgi:hypothetical protein